MSEQPKWSSSPAIICQHWGDGAVVFHKPSGKTHQLSVLGYTLLMLLQQAATKQSQLSIDCAAALDVSVEEVAVVIGDALQMMAELGLVEQDG